MKKILVEVSVGELLDKLSILEIKKLKIKDIHFLNDKRGRVKLEINNYTGSKIKEIKEYTSY